MSANSKIESFSHFQCDIFSKKQFNALKGLLISLSELTGHIVRLSKEVLLRNFPINEPQFS